MASVRKPGQQWSKKNAKYLGRFAKDEILARGHNFNFRRPRGRMMDAPPIAEEVFKTVRSRRKTF